MGIESSYYEEEKEEEGKYPKWLDGGQNYFMNHFSENNQQVKDLFEKIIIQYKSDKDDINVKCQKHWISVYKNDTMIFYVYAYRDRLKFDSKYSHELSDEINLETAERPENARIIRDTTQYFIVKEINEINEILKILNFSYSRL